MRYSILVIPIILCSSALGDTAAIRPARETLGAFVGDWDMELFADQETFGDRGGPGTGSMSCAWGPMEAWVDCDLRSHYAELGPYALKIILYDTGKDNVFGAFVTNSFGGGRLYSGGWESAGKLVYRDAWIDPGRRWQHQRTTYSFGNNGELSYVIEVSANGVDYLPHSRGIYKRK